MRKLNLLIVALFVLAGCGHTPSPEEKFDVHVNDERMKSYKQVDAIEFLAAGGRYVDKDEELGHSPMDRPHVLDLLKRIQADWKVAPIALIEPRNPQIAVAIMIRLPDRMSMSQAHQYLEVAQKTFPGAILQERGVRWLGLDFFSPEMEKMVDELNQPLGSEGSRKSLQSVKDARQ